MKFLLEFNSFYNIGDIVLIEYWYHDILVPCKVVEKISKNKLKVTHNIPESKIPNAPDEIIKTSDIIDKYRISNQ
jgi:hypothetical protein